MCMIRWQLHFTASANLGEGLFASRAAMMTSASPRATASQEPKFAFFIEQWLARIPDFLLRSGQDLRVRSSAVNAYEQLWPEMGYLIPRRGAKGLVICAMPRTTA